MTGPDPDFSKGAAWIRDEILPVGQASIGVLDWGLTHSDITYDVVPVWNGAFFRLPDYLERFRASVAALRLTIDQDAAAIAAILARITARSGLRRAYVAMVASRGAPMIPGSRDPRDCANHFYAWCIPYVHVIPEEVAARGASVWVPEGVHRIPEDSVNPRAKNYHWGDFTQGLTEAKDRGFDTTVLTDHQGNVTEGPGFNFFAVSGGRVLTSDHGVLEGMTRRTVLELCAREGFQTVCAPLPLAAALEADELFLTTSSGGVIPVTRLGTRIYGNGAPGPVATRLARAYLAALDDPAMRTEIDYTSG